MSEEYPVINGMIKLPPPGHLILMLVADPADPTAARPLLVALDHDGNQLPVDRVVVDFTAGAELARVTFLACPENEESP